MEAKIFSTPASSKRRDSFSIERAKKNKENKQRFTFATRRMTASRAILISRRRRGRPLNLNLDDATFGKPKSSVIPFSREHVLRFVCARVQINKKKTRDVKLVFVFLFFYSCLWIRSVARSKSSGCVVCKCVQMCAAFLPKYLSRYL